MTNKLKAAAMFQVLSLAPMQKAGPEFRQLAEDGRVEAFWKFYELCLRQLPHIDERIEREGKVSFRMLKPAIEAIYRASVGPEGDEASAAQPDQPTRESR